MRKRGKTFSVVVIRRNARLHTNGLQGRKVISVQEHYLFCFRQYSSVLTRVEHRLFIPLERLFHFTKQTIGVMVIDIHTLTDFRVSYPYPTDRMYQFSTKVRQRPTCVSFTQPNPFCSMSPVHQQTNRSHPELSIPIFFRFPIFIFLFL